MAKLDFSNLRVYIDDSNHYKYIELTKSQENQSGDKQSQAEDVPFMKMPDLFVAAACIGAKYDIYKEPTKKKDVFLAAAFDQKTQVPVLISLAYKKLGTTENLLEPRQILKICEGWANGGFSNLYDILIEGKGLRPLYRLVDYIINEQQNE